MAEHSFIPVPKKRHSIVAAGGSPVGAANRLSTFSFGDSPSSTSASSPRGASSSTQHSRRTSTLSSMASGDDSGAATPQSAAHFGMHSLSEETGSVAVDSQLAEINGEHGADADTYSEDLVWAPTRPPLDKENKQNRRGPSSISTPAKRSSTLGSVDQTFANSNSNHNQNTTSPSSPISRREERRLSRIPRAMVTHNASGSPGNSPTLVSTNTFSSTGKSNASGSGANAGTSTATSTATSAPHYGYGGIGLGTATPTRRSTLDQIHHLNGLAARSTSASLDILVDTKPVTLAASPRHDSGTTTTSASTSPRSPRTPNNVPLTPTPANPAQSYAAARAALRTPSGPAPSKTARLIEGLQTELDSTKAQLDRSKNEVRNCRREIGTLTRRHDDLREQYDRARGEADALQNVISRKERLMSEALLRAGTAEAEAAQHLAERKEVEERAQKSIAAAEAATAEAVAATQRADAETEALRDSVRSLRAMWSRDVRSYRDEVERLSSRMRAEREEAAHKRAQLLALVHAHSAEQQSIVALVDEVKANHAEAASAFQEQVDHLRAEVDRHAQDAEAARQLARELADELAHLREVSSNVSPRASLGATYRDFQLDGTRSRDISGPAVSATSPVKSHNPVKRSPSAARQPNMRAVNLRAETLDPSPATITQAQRSTPAVPLVIPAVAAVSALAAVSTVGVASSLAARTSVESSPVDRASVERTTIEQTAVDRTPVASLTAEHTPTETTPTERSPVDTTPTQRTPTARTLAVERALPAGVPMEATISDIGTVTAARGLTVQPEYIAGPSDTEVLDDSDSAAPTDDDASILIHAPAPVPASTPVPAATPALQPALVPAHGERAMPEEVPLPAEVAAELSQQFGRFIRPHEHADEEEIEIRSPDSPRPISTLYDSGSDGSHYDDGRNEYDDSENGYHGREMSEHSVPYSEVYHRSDMSERFLFHDRPVSPGSEYDNDGYEYDSAASVTMSIDVSHTHANSTFGMGAVAAHSEVVTEMGGAAGHSIDAVEVALPVYESDTEPPETESDPRSMYAYSESEAGQTESFNTSFSSRSEYTQPRDTGRDREIVTPADSETDTTGDTDTMTIAESPVKATPTPLEDLVPEFQPFGFGAAEETEEAGIDLPVIPASLIAASVPIPATPPGIVPVLVEPEEDLTETETRTLTDDEDEYVGEHGGFGVPTPVMETRRDIEHDSESGDYVRIPEAEAELDSQSEDGNEDEHVNAIPTFDAYAAEKDTSREVHQPHESLSDLLAGIPDDMLEEFAQEMDVAMGVPTAEVHADEAPVADAPRDLAAAPPVSSAIAKEVKLDLETAPQKIDAEPHAPVDTVAADVLADEPDVSIPATPETTTATIPASPGPNDASVADGEVDVPAHTMSPIIQKDAMPLAEEPAPATPPVQAIETEAENVPVLETTSTDAVPPHASLGQAEVVAAGAAAAAAAITVAATHKTKEATLDHKSPEPWPVAEVRDVTSTVDAEETTLFTPEREHEPLPASVSETKPAEIGATERALATPKMAAALPLPESPEPTARGVEAAPDAKPEITIPTTPKTTTAPTRLSAFIARSTIADEFEAHARRSVVFDTMDALPESPDVDPAGVLARTLDYTSVPATPRTPVPVSPATDVHEAVTDTNVAPFVPSTPETKANSTTLSDSKVEEQAGVEAAAVPLPAMPEVRQHALLEPPVLTTKEVIADGVDAEPAMVPDGVDAEPAMVAAPASEPVGVVPVAEAMPESETEAAEQPISSAPTSPDMKTSTAALQAKEEQEIEAVNEHGDVAAVPVPSTPHDKTVFAADEIAAITTLEATTDAKTLPPSPVLEPMTISKVTTSKDRDMAAAVPALSTSETRPNEAEESLDDLLMGIPEDDLNGLLEEMDATLPISPGSESKNASEVTAVCTDNVVAAAVPIPTTPETHHSKVDESLDDLLMGIPDDELNGLLEEMDAAMGLAPAAAPEATVMPAAIPIPATPKEESAALVTQEAITKSRTVSVDAASAPIPATPESLAATPLPVLPATCEEAPGHITGKSVPADEHVPVHPAAIPIPDTPEVNSGTVLPEEPSANVAALLATSPQAKAAAVPADFDAAMVPIPATPKSTIVTIPEAPRVNPAMVPIPEMPEVKSVALGLMPEAPRVEATIPVPQTPAAKMAVNPAHVPIPDTPQMVDATLVPIPETPRVDGLPLPSS